MKKTMLILFIGILAHAVNGQVSGNINYQNTVEYSDNNIFVSFPSNSDMQVSVKGLANVKANTYVAIFSVSQEAKTTNEVNKLIDDRINRALQKIQSKEGVSTYVDMISFVPIYEFDVEKKIFSKDSYNEVPAGFALKKNIHIKYSNPDLLDEIITILTNAEIYDLVRVDYFSDNLGAIKKELMTKAKGILQEKMKNYQEILSVDLDSAEKQLIDGYKVVLPVERYEAYQAYSSSSLNLKKNANVSRADKSITLYYQPIIDKEFDFVINPTILEPVIQVMYEIKLKINKEKIQTKKPSTEYFLITPNGDLKRLNVSSE